MNSFKNSELSTHKYLINIFWIFIRIYLLSEPAENIDEKSVFCLMVGFHLTELDRVNRVG